MKHSDRYPSPPAWCTILFAVAVLAVVAAITGCDAPAPFAAINPSRIEYHLPDTLAVVEFRLLDGTRCVLYSTHNVTCEWRQPVVLVPRVE